MVLARARARIGVGPCFGFACNVSAVGTDALSRSGAVLQVWFGEDIPRFWQVSPGENATLWHPISIDVATAIPYIVEEYELGVDPYDGDAF